MLLKKDDVKSIERTWALACKPRERVCVFLFDDDTPNDTFKGPCFFDPANVSSPAGKRPEQPLA